MKAKTLYCIYMNSKNKLKLEPAQILSENDAEMKHFKTFEDYVNYVRMMIVDGLPNAIAIDEQQFEELVRHYDNIKRK